MNLRCLGMFCKVLGIKGSSVIDNQAYKRIFGWGWSTVKEEYEMIEEERTEAKGKSDR